MDECWQMPNVSRLGEQEIGIFAELNILSEANAIVPVLETMAAALEASHLDRECQAWGRS